MSVYEEHDAERTAPLLEVFNQTTNLLNFNILPIRCHRYMPFEHPSIWMKKPFVASTAKESSPDHATNKIHCIISPRSPKQIAYDRRDNSDKKRRPNEP